MLLPVSHGRVHPHAAVPTMLRPLLRPLCQRSAPSAKPHGYLRARTSSLPTVNVASEPITANGIAFWMQGCARAQQRVPGPAIVAA